MADFIPPAKNGASPFADMRGCGKVTLVPRAFRKPGQGDNGNFLELNSKKKKGACPGNRKALRHGRHRREVREFRARCAPICASRAC